MNHARCLLVFCALSLAAGPALAGPVGNGFTYQGELKDGGVPANGVYDLTFQLFGDAAGTTAITGEVPQADITVTGGIFTVVLDFGAGIFNGQERWLRIGVRPGPSTGAYSYLAPLGQIHATPYALHALNAATGSGPWTTNGSGIDYSGKIQIKSADGDLVFTDDEGTIQFPDPDATNKPMINMFAVSSGNPGRMVIAHSPAFPTYGLRYQDLGDDFDFISNGNIVLRVDLDGRRVGIGTTVDPDGSLDVRSTGAGDIFNAYGSAGLAMTILNNGNVGIGTATPTTKLDVVGTIKTQVISITGGSDLAEPFMAAPGCDPRPGMVIAIDPANAACVRVANRDHDRTVAGIVSGAGGIRPGLTMGQEGTIADGTVPVALTGRVWCLVDADRSPVEPGDLLTTSSTPGHAMAVRDHDAARGAILGKALTALKDGCGLVLVLVSLQ